MGGTKGLIVECSTSEEVMNCIVLSDNSKEENIFKGMADRIKELYPKKGEEENGTDKG